MVQKKNKSKRGRPRKPPQRGRIKSKIAFLVDDLLDAALDSSITIDDLAAKAAILRSALDYLKLTKDEDEEADQSFFKLQDQSISKSLISPEQILLEDIQDIKGGLENE